MNLYENIKNNLKESTDILSKEERENLLYKIVDEGNGSEILEAIEYYSNYYGETLDSLELGDLIVGAIMKLPKKAQDEIASILKISDGYNIYDLVYDYGAEPALIVLEKYLPEKVLNKILKQFEVEDNDFYEAQNLKEAKTKREMPTGEEIIKVFKETYKEYVEDHSDVPDYWYFSVDPDGLVSINIPWGDWKHDHMRCDDVMKLTAEKLGLTFEDGWGEQEPYEEDGSDAYSADHVWEFELL